MQFELMINLFPFRLCIYHQLGWMNDWFQCHAESTVVTFVNKNFPSLCIDEIIDAKTGHLTGMGRPLNQNDVHVQWFPSTIQIQAMGPEVNLLYVIFLTSIYAVSDMLHIIIIWKNTFMSDSLREHATYWWIWIELYPSGSGLHINKRLHLHG